MLGRIKVKTPNIHVLKMAAPTKNRFPRPYCRYRRGRNGLGSEINGRQTIPVMIRNY